MDRLFQWVDKEGISHRMWTSFSDRSDAWYSAFNKCGWDQRTSLMEVEERRGGCIMNWFQLSACKEVHRFYHLYLSFNDTDRKASGYVKTITKAQYQEITKNIKGAPSWESL